MKTIALTLICLIPFALVSCGSSQPTESERLDQEREQLRQKSIGDAITNLDRLEKWFGADRGQPAPDGASACKAAIGILMGRDPHTMTAKARDANVQIISYRRPDGDRWSYLCEATPTKIQWATYENASQGPWRMADEVSYKIVGAKLAISMAGPETDKSTHHFLLPSLKQVD